MIRTKEKIPMDIIIWIGIGALFEQEYRSNLRSNYIFYGNITKQHLGRKLL